jgi:hypothetical protein
LNIQPGIGPGQTPGKGDSMSDSIIKPSADDKSIAEGVAKHNALPAGKVIATDAKKWYYLKANYIDGQTNKPATGYLTAVDKNASGSFWDYVTVTPGGPWGMTLRIQPRPTDGGWYFFAIHDDDANAGYHLDCKATGYLYRTNLYNTWWQIVDGKLYCSYWTSGVPAGTSYFSFLVSAGEYVGMGFSPAATFEFIEAPG